MLNKNFDFPKVVSVTTDGAPSMVEAGFVSKKHVGHRVLMFDCIIHQEILCAKSELKEL